MENPEKTDGGKLISSYECDAMTVDNEFMLSKQRYASLTGREQERGVVVAYHVRQSFKPGEVTPEEANRIGYEIALRFTKGLNKSREKATATNLNGIFKLKSGGI